jgi:hypothetical protein
MLPLAPMLEFWLDAGCLKLENWSRQAADTAYQQREGRKNIEYLNIIELSVKL